MPEAPAAPPPAAPVTPPADPPAPASPQPPAWMNDVPEKLRRATPEETIAEVIKSRNELERTLGSRGQPQAPTPPSAPESGLSIPEPSADDDLPTVLQKSGIDIAKIEKQLADGGKIELTEEQRAALRRAKPGLTNKDIDTFTAGLVAQWQLRQAKQAQWKQEAAAIAGGEDKLKFLLENAPGFVPAAELEGVREMVRDPVLFRQGIRLLNLYHAEHTKSGGSVPLITGSGGTADNGFPKNDAERVALIDRAAAGDADAQRILAAYAKHRAASR